MIEVNKIETHVRAVNARIDHIELAKIIAGFVGDKAGIIIDRPNVKYEVIFEDAKEGSPEYKIGTKVKVTIIEDLNYVGEGKQA